MEAGRFDAGCPAIEASYKLDPRPGTLFTLAECEAKRGRVATAAARYEDYLSVYARLSAEQRRKQGDREQIAREQQAALRLAIPMLTLTLPPDAPKEAVVKRDGAELSGAALGVALPVDPGEHRLTTQVPGGYVTELRITIDKGEKRELTLPVKTVLSVGPKPATGEILLAEQRSKIPTIVLGAGTLVLATIGGGLFGGAAEKLTATVKLDRAIGPGGCVRATPDSRCAELESTAYQVSTLSNVGIGMFVSAGVLGAATLTYLLLPPPKGTRPATQRAGIHVAPIVGTGQRGLIVSGAF